MKSLRQAAFLAWCLLLAGCGPESGTYLHRKVVFTDPDQIQEQSVAEAARGVVKLSTYERLGTGFFISGTGYLLTNHHVAGREVCPDECAGLTVHYRQEKGQQQIEYTGARLIFSDEDLDLALLQVDPGADQLDIVRLIKNDPDQPIREEWTVHIVGHPFAGLKKGTKGAIEYRSGEDYLIDGFAFPGNSGSPLLTPAGYAIGLVKAIYYRINDIDLDGNYTEWSMASTAYRILEKYPFLEGLNQTAPNPAAESALAEAVAAMQYGLPLSAAEVLSVQVESLGRADVDAVVRRLVNLRADGGYLIAASIWEHVLDTGIFEEYHRFFAGLALVALAATPEEKADAYDLLAAHLPSLDYTWTEAYLRLIYQLETDQAVSRARREAREFLGQYALDPLMASYYLAYGIQSVGSTDTLDIVENLFDYPELERHHDMVVRNLDDFRPEVLADEDRVVRILEDIQARSSLVRGIFLAELALYDRGHL